MSRKITTFADVFGTGDISLVFLNEIVIYIFE